MTDDFVTHVTPMPWAPDVGRTGGREALKQWISGGYRRRLGRSGGIISANGRPHLRIQVLEQRDRCGLEHLYRVIEPGGREFFLAGRRG